MLCDCYMLCLLLREFSANLSETELMVGYRSGENAREREKCVSGVAENVIDKGVGKISYSGWVGY